MSASLSDTCSGVQKVAEQDLPLYIELVTAKFHPRSVVVSFRGPPTT